MIDLSKKKSFENGIQFAWDSTSLELAQTCLRKYAYTMIEGLSLKNKSVHLIFGGHYASALERYYKLRCEGLSIDNALNIVVHETLIASWKHQMDKDGKPIPGTGAPQAFEDNKKTRVALIRTIIWYIEEFGDETDAQHKTYIKADGTPAVELSFAFEISDDIVLTGHLDRVVQEGDRLMVMDQKTTGGTVGPYYFDQYKMSNQMSLYAFAGTSILRSPISGVIIDAAQIAVNFSRFERGFTPRSKAQISEWLDDALFTIDTARHATAVERFPRNRTACGNYGGCPFRRLCEAPPNVRKNFIQSDYTSHFWDPLEAR